MLLLILLFIMRNRTQDTQLSTKMKENKCNWDNEGAKIH